ncbi:hypothetical protein BLA29_002367 [Euroglyphus maynei]|uniref:Uncharacterized protein n=1 Tax=Euroglyphus maynei TaxID=6958 RepID=A0A1Y3BKZ1_EURMA|nr:hypothetical protein BLA29_002367 [Euroglyphus maynei]
MDVDEQEQFFHHYTLTKSFSWHRDNFLISYLAKCAWIETQYSGMNLHFVANLKQIQHANVMNDSFFIPLRSM